jgi:hypothetical protein
VSVADGFPVEVPDSNLMTVAVERKVRVVLLIVFVPFLTVSLLFLIVFVLLLSVLMLLLSVFMLLLIVLSYTVSLCLQSNADYGPLK